MTNILLLLYLGKHQIACNQHNEYRLSDTSGLYLSSAFSVILFTVLQTASIYFRYSYAPEFQCSVEFMKLFKVWSSLEKYHPGIQGGGGVVFPRWRSYDKETITGRYIINTKGVIKAIE